MRRACRRLICEKKAGDTWGSEELVLEFVMKKVMIWTVLATALMGCLQSQLEQASALEPAVEPKKVDLQKLLDQFGISGAFGWLKSHRAAKKITKLASNCAKHP